ncbi:GNAT family N-acetyltransferase, partial [Clostridiaceae bacterium OttesenSCG-928-D20]|nr:GNAT family N-acetyltransferase [Clostridiaceae bacterium OttesenSCG-928-D20]
MIIRTLKKEDLKDFERLCAYCFEYSMQDGDDKRLHRSKDNPNLHFGAYLDDDKTLTSGFSALPYMQNFDGEDHLMLAVGGVATLPPYRRRGGIRACFEMALPLMYERGAALSYLYPFSTAYYRKFGYDNACYTEIYKIDLAQLPKIDDVGAGELLTKENPLQSEIEKVYGVWQ